MAIHNIGNGTILLDSGEDANIIDVDSPRPGMRRRRPRSWSEQQHPTDTVEENGEAKKQTMLEQEQGEKSLLASLSLLLEEERELEKCKSAESADGF